MKIYSGHCGTIEKGGKSGWFFSIFHIFWSLFDTFFGLEFKYKQLVNWVLVSYFVCAACDAPMFFKKNFTKSDY